MSEKLVAKDDTRTYSFMVTQKDATHFTIEMYGSTYTFVQKDGTWINAASNKMTMAPNLIKAVIAALPV